MYIHAYLLEILYIYPSPASVSSALLSGGHAQLGG